MFVIRKPQLDALIAGSVDTFVRRLASDARARLSRHCAKKTDDELFALINAAIVKARTFGLRAPDDLELFVPLVIAHGLKFDESKKLAWTHAILADKDLVPAVKICVVLDRLPKNQQPDYVPPPPRSPHA